jgi:ISXO2-like transposase domain
VVSGHASPDADQAGLLLAGTGRRLGTTQTTAWKIKHKLAQVMMERDAQKPLECRVEMDDAFLGGERSGGKRGRKSWKTPIVAAVETTKDGRPVRLKLRRIKRHGKKEIKKLAGMIVKPGTTVVTDGLSCFNGLADADCQPRL